MTRPPAARDPQAAIGEVWHYAVPSQADPGRWLVVYRVPGTDAWTSVMDCPTEAVAQREADRRNPISMPPPRVFLRNRLDANHLPETVQ